MTQRNRRRLLAKHIRTSRIGPRCKEFYVGCIVCGSYHFLDTFGRFPNSFEESSAYYDILRGIKP